MYQYDQIELFFSRPESETNALRIGLFLALCTTLGLIHIPLPAPKEHKESPIVSITPLPQVIPKMRTEEPDQVALSEKKGMLLPVREQALVLDPEVRLEDEVVDTDLSFEASAWEFDAPERAPDTVFHLESPGVEPPIFIQKVAPDYPKLALRHGLQGYVILQATLTRDGTISDVEVIKGLGDNRFGFESKAEQALMKWRFEPGRLNGQPVSVRLVLRIDFVMS